MSSDVFSPMAQYRVLKAVDAQCGYEGSRSVLLSVDGMSSADISRSCRLLKELGLIEAESWETVKGPVFYPVRITNDGILWLSEANRSFWDYAEEVATDAVKQWTGLKMDIPAMVGFFKSVSLKYQQEKGGSNV